MIEAHLIHPAVLPVEMKQLTKQEVIDDLYQNNVFTSQQLVVNNKTCGHYIITASTVKKSVSKRRGRTREPLREDNDEHDIMEDKSSVKNNNSQQMNKMTQAH